VVITKRGLYRFDVEQSRIKVFEGVLGVTVNGQSSLVGSGKAINTTTASVEKFDKEPPMRWTTGPGAARN
jgi:hypothetical protein